MRKMVGLIALVIGIMLLVWGHNNAASFGSQVQQLVNGTPTDRVMYFYIGGTALVLYGIVQLVWTKKK